MLNHNDLSDGERAYVEGEAREAGINSAALLGGLHRAADGALRFKTGNGVELMVSQAAAHVKQSGAGGHQFEPLYPNGATVSRVIGADGQVQTSVHGVSVRAGYESPIARDPNAKPTYAELLASPALLAEWTRRDPQYVTAAADAAIDSQRGIKRTPAFIPTEEVKPNAAALDDPDLRRRWLAKDPEHVFQALRSQQPNQAPTAAPARPSYAQLMSDPALLSKWQEVDPVFVARAADEHLAAQRAAYARR